jgi:hypothetical protein
VTQTAYPDEIPLSAVKVVRPCKRCYPDQPEIAAITEIYLVSPTGVVHHGADFGVTGCGIDATGPNWWWRL